MPTTPSNVSKLPKWAQARIALLERQVREAEEAVRRVYTDNGDTDIYVLDSSRWVETGNLGHGLPRHTHIAIELNETTHLTVTKSEHGYVEVMASGRGGSALIVQPQSSNVIKITAGDWL